MDEHMKVFAPGENSGSLKNSLASCSSLLPHGFLVAVAQSGLRKPYSDMESQILGRTYKVG